ncbi:nucleotidyltransferase family protein [Nitratireductor sp. XY-223]|uniref:nucleotidyltransferase family protein n=1 Tax=Nitratireductor sp. XY-223 TaxID=2561926 RepID=UPI0010AA4807|nr:nucleotidyltransferase family protein [Nitratireductor sp. XY-223]
MDHLRYAGLPFARQRAVLIDIVRDEPIVRDALVAAREFGLPQWRIVAGAIYNTVWNVLTDRPSGHGIKDIDLFYYEPHDLSWEAEDRVIKRGHDAFSGAALPVEIRNQARVHLWFPEKFGEEYAPLENGDESISRFSSKTHAVGIRLEEDDSLDVCAPFGLDDIFSFRVVPNRVLYNEPGYTAKAERALQCWPELDVEPW